VTSWDWWVISAYLCGTLGLSAWLARRQHSTADYYVAGRALPWWALGISTLATQSSANSFIGIPAFVALVPGGGLTWLQYELMVPVAMIFICLVLMLRGLQVISVYEYLERRFDRTTRLVLSAVFLLSRGLATGVALYATALVVQVCTGLPLPWCIVGMGGVTVIYDSLGGMRAVVWTDVLQMVILLGGIAVCLACAVDLAGGPLQVLQSFPAERLRAVQWSHGLGDGARAPLWGFVAGGLVLYVSYYGVDQSQVQRQLSSTSVAAARRVLLLNGLARFPLTLLYVALGLGVGAVLAQHEDLRAAVAAGRPDTLMPRFIELYLPAGLRGLLVAAILAAAMSSLDSALNSLSASTMRDFVEQRVPEHRRVLASRCTTVVWGALITAFALAVGDLGGNVVEGINQVGAMFYGPLLAAFLTGACDSRARGPAVLAGVALGLAANLVLVKVLGAAVYWMWWNVSGLAVAVLVTTLGSRLMPAPKALQLVGTTLDGQALAAHWRASRPQLVALLLYAAGIFFIVVLVDRGLAHAVVT
jgi:SSS family solute:Na+ symporter